MAGPVAARSKPAEIPFHRLTELGPGFTLCRVMLSRVTSGICLVVVVLAPACKQGPEAKEPAATPASSEPAPESSPEKPMKPEPMENPAAVAAEQAQLVEALLSHRSLATYLHPELAERVPVTLRPSGLVNGALAIEAFGQRVRVADEPSALLLDWSQKGDSSARIRVSYPLEGIRGEVVLERVEREWIIVSVNLLET